MNATSRRLKRNTKKTKMVAAKKYLRNKFEQYRKENNHLTSPPSIKDFAENRKELFRNFEAYHDYKETLAKYNRDLLDYTGYKVFMYRKLSGMTKENETYNGYS